MYVVYSKTGYMQSAISTHPLAQKRRAVLISITLSFLHSKKSLIFQEKSACADDKKTSILRLRRSVIMTSHFLVPQPSSHSPTLQSKPSDQYSHPPS